MNLTTTLHPFTQNARIPLVYTMPEYNWDVFSLENDIIKLLPHLKKPFIFFLEDYAIKFQTKCKVKGLILINNLSIYINDVFFGFLVNEIQLDSGTLSLNPTEQKLSFIDIIYLNITSSNTLVESLQKNKTAMFEYVLVNGPKNPTLLENVYRNERIKNAIFAYLQKHYHITLYDFLISPMNIVYDKTETYYLTAFLHNDPLAAFNFKVEREVKTASFYLCDFLDSKWSVENERSMNKYIKAVLEKIETFGDNEKKYFKSGLNINKIREAFLESLQNDANKFCITEVLDSNQNLFAMSNTVFDQTTSIPVLRKIKPFDFIETTTGWDYSEEDSNYYKEDLSKYLKSIFPEENELNYVLGFIATLLYGERKLKSALVFTDNTMGNNGKTAFVRFLINFFGPYSISYKKYLQKGSYTANSNSHDANGRFFKGKRIYLCDDITQQTEIDNDLFKQITGTGFAPEGRIIGQGSKYKYNWEAGLIFVFNKDCCPTFDFKDKTIKERLVVFQMRSKFVAANLLVENTLPIDPELVEKFPKWMSSFFDLLKTKWSRSFHINNEIPKSCIEWRDELWERATNGHLFDWLDNNLLITENENDTVQIQDILHYYPGNPELKIQKLRKHNKTGILVWLSNKKRLAKGREKNNRLVIKKIKFCINEED